MISRNKCSVVALVSSNSALEDDMKKIALIALVGQRPLRSEERQVAGVDEHHQGSAEGRAGIQVSEVSTALI
jgi:hypothetical protein